MSLPPPELPPLWTVDEVCEYLRVSRPTVYKLVEEGNLTLVKVRRDSRITETSLVKYLGLNDPVDLLKGAEA